MGQKQSKTNEKADLYADPRYKALAAAWDDLNTKDEDSLTEESYRKPTINQSLAGPLTVDTITDDILIEKIFPAPNAPHLYDRERRLSKAFASAGIYQLWVEICQIAQETLDKGDKNQLKVKASMDYIIDDAKLPQPHLLNLLQTIDSSLINPLIFNTIGYWYTKLPRVQKVCLPVAGRSGVYVNTSVRYRLKPTNPSAPADPREVEGKWLDRSELVRYQKMVRNYLECKPDDPEAIAIDNAFPWSKAERAKVDHKLGERRFCNHGDVSDIYMEALSRRIHPGGDDATLMIQSPLYTGFANNLARRQGEHGLEGNLGSNKPWGLFNSCMVLMGIPMSQCFIPVFYVWNKEQLNVAEAGMFILTGSLVTDGGYNAQQAGGLSMRGTALFFENEKTDLFSGDRGGAFEKNGSKFCEQLKARQKAEDAGDELDAYVKTSVPPWTKLAEQYENTKKAETRFEAAMSKMEGALLKYRDDTKRRCEQIQAQIDAYDADIAFIEALNKHVYGNAINKKK
jgi:hypothetical protein